MQKMRNYQSGLPFLRLDRSLYVSFPSLHEDCGYQESWRGCFPIYPVGKELRLSKSHVLKFVSIDEVFRYTTVIITFHSFMLHLSSIQFIHSIFPAIFPCLNRMSVRQTIIPTETPAFNAHIKAFDRLLNFDDSLVAKTSYSHIPLRNTNSIPVPPAYKLLRNCCPVELPYIPYDERNCAVCFEPFNTIAANAANQNLPLAKSLPCGHLMCQNCMAQ